MSKHSLIPFIGIGSMGAMALSNLPLDIRKCVITIYFGREDAKIKVYSDLQVQYSYSYKTGVLNSSNVELFLSFLERNINNTFIVANLGGDAAAACAITTVESLTKLGKKPIIHVSEPFHFQSQVVKQKAINSIAELRSLGCEVSIGNNGDILKECGHDMLFDDFMYYRSRIIYDVFRDYYSLDFDNTNKEDSNKNYIHNSILSRIIWKAQSLFRSTE